MSSCPRTIRTGLKISAELEIDLCVESEEEDTSFSRVKQWAEEIFGEVVLQAIQEAHCKRGDGEDCVTKVANFKVKHIKLADMLGEGVEIV